jgi:hypothetical protein
MEKPKLNQIFWGIIVLLVGVLSCIVILSLTLLPPQLGFISESSLAWVFLAVFWIVIIESGLWWTKQSFKIEERKLEYKERNIWSHIALFYQYADMTHYILLSFILLALIGFVSYFLIYMLIHNPISFSKQFFILASVYGVYVVARKPLKSTLKKTIKPIGQKTLSKYALTDKGFIIDLNIKNMQEPLKKYLVSIGFDEISDLKTFSFIEAQTFLKYELGLNIELVAKQTKDLYEYIKGQIARPSVYTITSVSSLGKTVFFKGPDLFYLLTFDAEDVSDLISAYNSFKAKGR